MTMIDCCDRSVFPINSTAVLLIETVPRPIPVRCPNFLCRLKSFLKQPIQNAAGQSGVASDLVGVFDLAGDFSFTERHRVQTRCDAKQMTHGSGALVQINVRI